MYNEEKMNKALRTFDWSAVLDLLPDQSLESLRKLLTDVSRSGCLIRMYRLSAVQDELRTTMIEELKTLSAKVGGAQAQKYVEFLRHQIDVTELALGEIGHSLDEDGYSRLSPELQAWSALIWASREMLQVHRQVQENLDNRRRGETVVIDPLTIRLDKEHGHGLAAGRVHQLSQTVANTLRMLGHRNNWSASGKFTLPRKVEPTLENLSAAARIARLGDVWQAVLDESRYHRYWGGHFEVQDADEEQKSVFPDLEHVIVSVKTERERRDDIQIAEYIALNRMQRKQFSVYQNIARSTAKHRVKNPRAEEVALAPAELVSQLEMATLYTLDVDMHLNPIGSPITFGGLTIMEWLRGYCVLEECYSRRLPEHSDGVIQINVGEFLGTLQRAGLSPSKAKTFFERVIFQAGRRDLYDAPLLRTSDDQYYFLAALYHGIDIALIILSQIGSRRLNVESKGKAFEKAVLKMFTDAGLIAKTFKFTVGNTQYDCDVAVLWDRNLFIVECKNYGLPTDDPADRSFFWNRQVEAMQQIERIAKDLREHPEIVRQHFGPDATWDKTHAVVLNASFLSFRRSRAGTFFYDASALGRFLKEGTLNETQFVPRGQEHIKVSIPVKRLWKGARPTSVDLLREMKDPSQVVMERDKYYLARKLLPLSTTAAVMIEEAASKPPDFEPLADDAPEKYRAKNVKQPRADFTSEKGNAADIANPQRSRLDRGHRISRSRVEKQIADWRKQMVCALERQFRPAPNGHLKWSE